MLEAISFLTLYAPREFHTLPRNYKSIVCVLITAKKGLKTSHLAIHENQLKKKHFFSDLKV